MNKSDSKSYHFRLWVFRTCFPLNSTCTHSVRQCDTRGDITGGNWESRYWVIATLPSWDRNSANGNYVSTIGTGMDHFSESISTSTLFTSL